MNTRATRQRSAVLAVLTDREDFVSAQELHTLLVSTGVHMSLTTVYRALRDLEAEGGVDIAQVRPGERLFRRRPVEGHRHYLICRRCCASRPVDSEAVETWAGRIAAASGFAAVEHMVELTGLCASCQSAADG